MIPFETTQYLCMSSCLMGFSALVLFFIDKPLSLFMGILCLTSLNHWRKYQHGGWRQLLDLTWVNICCLYFMKEFLFYGNEYQQYIAFSVLICILIFFQISKTYMEQWIIFHMSIHIYASFFVPILFIL